MECGGKRRTMPALCVGTAGSLASHCRCGPIDPGVLPRASEYPIGPTRRLEGTVCTRRSKCRGPKVTRRWEAKNRSAQKTPPWLEVRIVELFGAGSIRVVVAPIAHRRTFSAGGKNRATHRACTSGRNSVVDLTTVSTPDNTRLAGVRSRDIPVFLARRRCSP
jgi:hypothetical protein